jgi:serine acetyltransferase
MLVAEVDAPGPRSRTNAPLLGSGVSQEPHSAVCGAVKVGDGVTVSPGCVVRTDIADGVAVTPRPLKIRTSAVAAAPAKR